MTSVLLCALAFLLTLCAGWRSLAAGVFGVLAVGYAYGIVRANLAEAGAHFLFDAAVAGLYASWLARGLTAGERERTRSLRAWLWVLIGWPMALLLLPMQDPLIHLVGLRGNALLVPFLLIGALLTSDEKYKLALRIAGLNLLAFAFAVAEFVFGVEHFLPFGAVTEIIYASGDASAEGALRIPASFSSAHAYAGTMVSTLPLLVGAWMQTQTRRWHGPLIMLTVFASLLGVFLAAVRVHFVVAAVLVSVAILSRRVKARYRLAWVAMAIVMSLIVGHEERLQRFTMLRDAGAVVDRVAGSVNMTLLDVLSQYPFGNGLGGGGTSIPYFLRDRIEYPIRLENEYARIVLEEGIIGLLLWLAFFVWALRHHPTRGGGSWRQGRLLAWCFSLVSLFAALIGIGLLTSIPATCMLLLNMGWIVASDEVGGAERLRRSTPVGGGRSGGQAGGYAPRLGEVADERARGVSPGC